MVPARSTGRGAERPTKRSHLVSVLATGQRRPPRVGLGSEGPQGCPDLSARRPPWVKKDHRLARYRAEKAPTSRSETARDRDRILYSSAFLRLAGITQVASTE